MAAIIPMRLPGPAAGSSGAGAGVAVALAMTGRDRVDPADAAEPPAGRAIVDEADGAAAVTAGRAMVAEAVGARRPAASTVARIPVAIAAAEDTGFAATLLPAAAPAGALAAGTDWAPTPAAGSVVPHCTQNFAPG